MPRTGKLSHSDSFPRLYLASGVTTARTTGSIEPYADLNIKAMIDNGKTPGPKLDLTGPYINGKGSIFPQMHELSGPEEAKEFVRYWHSVGFTSMKAYAEITPEELRAAIDESHKVGMKITGHLCCGSCQATYASQMSVDHPLPHQREHRLRPATARSTRRIESSSRTSSLPTCTRIGARPLR